MCVKLLPNVYNPKEKPWLKPENETSEALVSQISKLSFRRVDYKKVK
ncbi:(4Fe-4S)-binding protein [Empedobacter sp.]